MFGNTDKDPEAIRVNCGMISTSRKPQTHKVEMMLKADSLGFLFGSSSFETHISVCASKTNQQQPVPLQFFTKEQKKKSI